MDVGEAGRVTRILAVAGDAGGAAALAPVLRALAALPAIDLRVLAYRQARAVWSKLRLPIESLPENAPADPSTWDRLAPIDLVFTGTSVNGVDHERAAIQWATDMGVPSLSVVDFWSNYASRFRGTADAPLELPTAIAVMDERAKCEMVVEGFPDTRLVVTGQPALDDIVSFRAHWNDSARRAARRELQDGADDEATALVLFASQPLAEMSALTGGGAAPVHERSVLRSLVESLDVLADADGTEILLVVRPHPREHIAEADLPTARRVRVVVSRAARPWAAALAADMVVGMTSVLVVEAALLGCTVVSIQPGQQHADPLPAQLGGSVARVYDLATLPEALRCALTKSRTTAPRSLPTPERTATERIVDLIFTLLADHGDRND